MLGLFLLIPIFTIYAAHLEGATPRLIGLALGGYGLTQGLLQIPFGMLSDRFGRKPILTLGLILFATGSLIGAWSDSIYGLIVARTLQGTGAIGSVLIALLADLTPDEQRTKAMAVIGMTIGTSFSLAMVLSPWLAGSYGLTGIFYLTTGLAVSGILLLYCVIPTPVTLSFHSDSEAKTSLIGAVLKNHHLVLLDLGIFCQHLILTATFFSIPMLLVEQVHAGNLTQQWYFYLPLILASFVLMIPFIILAERKKMMKTIFVVSVGLTAFSQCLLAVYFTSWIGICLLMFFYFTAFNILEASLPSLVSRQAPASNKGTAMGVYSTCQFLGIFAGGASAGFLYQWGGNQSIFMANCLVAVVWLLSSFFMKPNMYLATLILPCTELDPSLHTQLLSVPGVKEVLLSTEKQVVYLKIDKQLYQSGSAEKLLIR